MQPEAYVEAILGIESLREFQRSALQALLRGRDAFVCVATGGGKSLVYQAAAVALRGAVVVVSPLVGLIDDQLEECARRGLQAGRLTASTRSRGGTEVLFATPERLQAGICWEGLQPAVVCVDEAHCVSLFGNSFRPAYTELGLLRRRWPQAPLLALSASVTHAVHRDVCRTLGLRQQLDVLSCMIRPNLRFEVRSVPNLRAAEDMVAQQLRGKSIVYVRTKRQCEQFAARCGGLAYHAGLDNRPATLAQFAQADPPITVVATLAFGMGVNIPDVDDVWHIGSPDTAAAYYQEAGRAGRDGRHARALLVTFKADLHPGRDKMVAQGEHAGHALLQLQHMRAYARLASGCRQHFLTRGFVSRPTRQTCQQCDLCPQNPQHTDAPPHLVQQVVRVVSLMRGRFGRSTILAQLEGRKQSRHPWLKDRRPHDLPRDADWNSALEQAIIQGKLRPVAIHAQRPILVFETDAAAL